MPHSYDRTLASGAATGSDERPLAALCLSVRPHGITLLPLDGILRNLIFDNLRSYVEKVQVTKI
jgi:uncharacterized spore protein YtfJ